MSDNIDPNAVVAACMADLSRMRQEELPLSNEKKKGPSFNPQGKNGTAHISAKVKASLANKWGVEIHDEESRQVEGLYVEDARPWAKKLGLDLIKTGRIGQANRIRAEAGPVQSSGSRTTLTQKSKNPPVPNRAQLAQNRVARGGVAVVPKQASKPVQPAVAKPAVVKSETIKKATAPPQPAPPELRVHVVDQDEAAVSGANELVVITGHLQLAKEKHSLDSRLVSVKGTIVDENRAYISLFLKGNDKRNYDVLRFDAPIMEDEYCVLRHKGPPTFAYYARLADSEETAKFCEYVRLLQEAANSLAADAAQEDDGNMGFPDNPACGADIPPIASTGEATPHSEEAPAQSTSAEGTLIDMDGFVQVPNRNQVLGEPARILSNVIHQIMVQLQARSDISKAIQDGLEDATIEHWINEASITGGDHLSKEMVINLVRVIALSHYGIAVNTTLDDLWQPLAPTPATPSPPTALRPPAQSTEASRQQEAGRHDKRIQYTAVQIETLRHKGAPTPKELKAQEYLPKAAATVLKTEAIPKADTLDSVDADGPRYCAVPVEDVLDDDFDTAMGNTEYTRPVVKRPFTGVTAALAPGSKGLSHSRWAKAAKEPSVNHNLPGSGLAPLHFGGSAATLDCSNIEPAEAPAVAAKLRPGVKGLSASRYASGEPVKFAGYFTGND